MSGTGRESHQGKPGCYCSEEGHRSPSSCRRGLSSAQIQTPAAQVLR